MLAIKVSPNFHHICVFGVGIRKLFTYQILHNSISPESQN